ncbi:hypothetical protein O3M35_009499 [Rhynocoris fuscipes]|uniref:Uncharacterized protein n=1 Tax=Rhynocoris fuscipes TaxID=488301 RepID=A0AAW1D353_9HEMI
MWKCFSRGVRETFERGFRALRPTETPIKNDTTEHTTYCRKYNPCCLETISKYKCTDNDDKKGSSHRTTQDVEHTILGAVSCSSALVLGWFLTQPCLWKKWWNQTNPKGKCPRTNVVRLLAKVANTQPINVGLHSDTTLAVNRSDTTDVVDSSGVQFGPKTADEVLNEAAEELKAVHESVVASSENSRGVDYISAKRHREAVALFRSASLKGYAPAAYNLAQCYEMGIGTKQDFVQAAKWYQVAADNGHATAMYNLGVFYAHGWGGLTASSETARKLFEQAAEKGQVDAKAALGLDRKNKDPPFFTGMENSKDWEISQDANEFDHKENGDEFYKMALSYESSACDDISAPRMAMQLHVRASEMGHPEARERLQLLQAYEAIGLLPEFLCGKKRSETNFFMRGISPAIVL